MDNMDRVTTDHLYGKSENVTESDSCQGISQCVRVITLYEVGTPGGFIKERTGRMSTLYAFLCCTKCTEPAHLGSVC